MKTTQEKISVMQMVQVVFIVPLFTNFALPHHSAGISHGRALAIFDLVVAFVCITGTIITQLKIAQLKKTQASEYRDAIKNDPRTIIGRETPNDAVWPPPPQIGNEQYDLRKDITVDPRLQDSVASVQYSSSRADQWRNEKYVLTHRPQVLLGLLIIPIFLSMFIAPSTLPLGIPTTVFILSAIFAGWIICMAFILYAQFLKRFPTPQTVRICQTKLFEHGFQDVTPDKSTFFSWHEVKAIKEDQGDVYFWVGAMNSTCIPRSAFQYSGDAQAFYQAALSLWKTSIAQ